MAPIVRGNSLYTIVDGPSWSQAEANSVKLGGHLVAISTKQEEDFIIKYAEYVDSSRAWWWMGLQYDQSTKTFRWLNGEDTGYRNWYTGSGLKYPDVALLEGIYGYTEFTANPGMNWTGASPADGKWAVSALSSERQGIAETSFIRRGDSAYVIVPGPTWAEAEANAVKLGGHLVTINDAAENEWLVQSFRNANKGYQPYPNDPDEVNNDVYWNGFNKRAQTDKWVWSSGESSSFTNWALGRPGNFWGSTNEAVEMILEAHPEVITKFQNAEWVSTAGNWSNAPAHITRYGIAEIKLAPNNQPTGTASLTGTAKVGSTLTIDATTVKDTDNFTGYIPTYQYNWETSTDGTTWSKLTSADATDKNTTYTLTAAEVGKQVRGVVSYLDGYGTNEAVNSAASTSITTNLTIRGNSIYTIVDGPSWTQAEANSVKLGGHLASISSNSENQFLFSKLVEGTQDDNKWIGLTDKTTEGKWEWSNQEYVGFTKWATQANPPQPDNLQGNQNYAYFWDDFPSYWDDAPDIGAEISYGIAETPFVRRGDSAYVIVQGPTWEEAEANAVKLGGHLVTINDAAENEWLKEYQSKNTQISWGVWIGGSDSYQEGYWTDPTGQKLGYTNWLIGEPNNINTYNAAGEDYAAMLVYPNDPNKGKWADIANKHPTDNSIFLGIAEIKLAPNNQPTGTPSVTGTTKVGSTLTIDASAVKDADNFTGYTPTYQYSWETSTDGTTWSKLTSTDATDNNNTYTLTSAEVGKQLRGVVSYLDGYGTNEVVNSSGAIVLPVTPQTQQVSTIKPQLSYQPSKSVSVPLQYTTSTGDAQLSGLTLNVHYNSSILTPTSTNNGVSDQATATIATNKIVEDTNNLDGDPLTDKILQLVWTTFDNTFPNKTLPTNLATLNFTTSAQKTDPVTGKPTSTTIRYTASETAATYDFVTGSTTLTALPFSLDVDGDGQVKALTDGLMIIRKLLGPAFDGDALTYKALSSTATRTTAEIHTYLQQAMDGGLLDIDKNGKTGALTDGLMVIRRLLGPAFDGDALTYKALSSDSPYFGKADASTLVAANIDALKPLLVANNYNLSMT